MGIRKSRFMGATEVPGSATLDFVSGADNLKITHDDFVAGLGVSGKLLSSQDANSVEILQKEGSNNRIRGIKAGPGMSIELVSKNSLRFSAQISSPDNIININSKSDLPTPVSGVITLEDNTGYYLGGIDIQLGTDRLLLGTNTSILGTPSASTITYTGTDPLFSAVDPSVVTIKDVRISCPSAVCFSFLGSFAFSGIYNLLNLSIDSCAKLMNMTNVLGMVIDTVNISSADDGITVGGTNSAISISRMGTASSSVTFVGIDFGATQTPTIELRDLLYSAPVGAVGISGLVDSGNVSSNNIASVQSCEFLGGITPLNNISTDDYRWSFMDNSSNVMDTSRRSVVKLIGNIAATNIIDSTPVLVAGAWTQQLTSQFTTDANGRITYIGEKPLSVSVDFAMDIELVSGSNKFIRAMIGVNGTPVTDSGRRLTLGTSEANPATGFWELTMNQNDFIEPFVQNITDTVNVIVSAAIIRVKA